MSVNERWEEDALLRERFAIFLAESLKKIQEIRKGIYSQNPLLENNRERTLYHNNIASDFLGLVTNIRLLLVQFGVEIGRLNRTGEIRFRERHEE